EGRAAVHRIARHRRSHPSELRAQLVLASRLWRKLEQRAIPDALEQAPRGARELAALVDDAGGPPFDRQQSVLEPKRRTEARRRARLDPRHVRPPHPARLHLIGDRRVRLAPPREEQDAAGLLVEALMDAQVT